MQEVLSFFNEYDRLLILLIELEGNSYKETADILNTTESAIRLRLHRVRKKFPEILKKHGINIDSESSIKGEEK